MPTNDTDSFRTLFLRHDLMVELDVIDGAIQHVLASKPDRGGADFAHLELERTRVAQALRSLDRPA
jgi:hypothetical protein